MKKYISLGLITFLFSCTGAKNVELSGKSLQGPIYTIEVGKKIGNVKGELYKVELQDTLRNTSIDTYAFVLERDGKTYFFLMPQEIKGNNLYPTYQVNEGGIKGTPFVLVREKNDYKAKLP